MPTIGNGSGPHLEMGTGALIPAALIPAPAKNPFNDPATVAGPAVIFIDLKPGSGAAGSRSLQKMTGPLTNQFNFGVSISPVQRPAEIVNYRSMGTTPAILGAALGAGAAAALALTLVASVRRRRRDLALLKTLGLSRRQLAAVVAWQSSVAVAIGTVVGVPLGIVVGRSLWQLFANEINAVPTPERPGPVDRPHRRRGPGAGQRRRVLSRPHRRPHSDGPAPAGGVARGATPSGVDALGRRLPPALDRRDAEVLDRFEERGNHRFGHGQLGQAGIAAGQAQRVEGGLGGADPAGRVAAWPRAGAAIRTARPCGGRLPSL